MILLVSVVTYRHIVLKFHSTTVTPEEIIEIANKKRDGVCEQIGHAGITGNEKGKTVFWELEKG